MTATSIHHRINCHKETIAFRLVLLPRCHRVQSVAQCRTRVSGKLQRFGWFFTFWGIVCCEWEFYTEGAFSSLLLDFCIVWTSKSFPEKSAYGGRIFCSRSQAWRVVLDARLSPKSDIYCPSQSLVRKCCSIGMSLVTREVLAEHLRDQRKCWVDKLCRSDGFWPLRTIA